jgi:hypothetical protein
MDFYLGLMSWAALGHWTTLHGLVGEENRSRSISPFFGNWSVEIQNFENLENIIKKVEVLRRTVMKKHHENNVFLS